MPAPVGPGGIDKASLTIGRLIHKPFEVPMKFTLATSAIGVGRDIDTGQKDPEGKPIVKHLPGLTEAIKGANMAVGSAYMALEPKGPAKWLGSLFMRVDQAADKSLMRATRSRDMYWGPASQAVEQLGTVASTPFVSKYARAAGFPDSDPAVIQALLHSKGYPKPAPPAEAPAEQAPAPPPAVNTQAGPPAEGGQPVEGQQPPAK